MAWRYLFIGIVALAVAGCAVNPLTPTPQAALPSEVVVATETHAAGLVLAAAKAVEPTSTPTRTPEVTPTRLVLVTPEPTEPPTAEPTPVIAANLGPPANQGAPPTQGPAPTAGPPTAPPPTPILVAPPPSDEVAAAEQYTIDLINAQRAAAGLHPLLRDETVMSIARARVADMVARGYTGHYDPVTGISLGKSMLQAAGYGNWVGENWYGSGSSPVSIAERAMAWFMTDPPHYRNILHPNYTVVGVGIAHNGRTWLLVQNFAGQ